jgi:hypothetical protein
LLRPGQRNAVFVEQYFFPHNRRMVRFPHHAMVPPVSISVLCSLVFSWSPARWSRGFHRMSSTEKINVVARHDQHDVT